MEKSDFVKRIENELILATKQQIISSYSAEILEDLCKVWSKHNLDIILSTDSPNKIRKLFNDLCNEKTLSPVNFDTDEVIDLGNGFVAYKRCKHLIKNTITCTISYNMAYQIICNRIYYVYDKFYHNFYPEFNKTYAPNKVYLSKGGVITNQYIEKVYVKGDIFMPKDPVNLDCHYVKIDTNGKFIYTIDSRSNKLKALMEFYEVPILTDDKFKNIDLRNFKFKENRNNVSNN